MTVFYQIENDHSFSNSVEHGRFYMFPDILEHGHFSI